MSYVKKKKAKKNDKNKTVRSQPTVKTMIGQRTAPKASLKEKKVTADKLNSIILKNLLSLITPKVATELLEANTINRPIRQKHVDRLVNQILMDLWIPNGETIKISTAFDVLDGQHRLWSIIIADKAIESLIVTGISPEAFTTIDTIRQSRTGGDTLSLEGLKNYRAPTATALSWLLRWQAGCIPEYKSAEYRVENGDLKEIYREHPNMVNAIQRVMHVKSLISPGIMGFLYYILSNQDAELANRFIETLENPASVEVSDPFYRFRVWLIQSLEHKKRRDPVLLIALAFKAWNLAMDKKSVEVLSWRQQGKSPEMFPFIGKKKK